MADGFDPYHKWLGIRPEEQPPNLYRLLGITPLEDDPDVIEAAADQRMAHLRTYQVGPHGPLSQQLLNEVSAARVILLNVQKKADYDARLRGELDAKTRQEAPALRASPVGEQPGPDIVRQAPPPLPTVSHAVGSSENSLRFHTIIWAAVGGVAAVAILVLVFSSGGNPSPNPGAAAIAGLAGSAQRDPASTSDQPNRSPTSSRGVIAGLPGSEKRGAINAITGRAGGSAGVQPDEPTPEPEAKPKSKPPGISKAGRLRLASKEANSVHGVREFQPPETIGHLPYRMLGVALSPDGSTVAATASGEPGLVAWNIASGQNLYEVRTHGLRLNAVAFHPRGACLVAGSEKGVLTLRDPAKGKLLLSLSAGGGGSVLALAFIHDGSLVAVGFDGGSVTIVELATSRIQHRFKGSGVATLSVAFSPSGSQLAGAMKAGNIQIWDLASYKRQHSLEGHLAAVNGIAFSPDGATLASGSTDASVRLWDPVTGKLKQSLDTYGVKIRAVAFSPDGSLLAATGAGRGLKLLIWETGNYELRQLIPLSEESRVSRSLAKTLAFTPDGDTIVTAVNDVNGKLIKLVGRASETR